MAHIVVETVETSHWMPAKREVIGTFKKQAAARSYLAEVALMHAASTYSPSVMLSYGQHGTIVGAEIRETGGSTHTFSIEEV